MENTITWHKSCASRSHVAFVNTFKITRLFLGGYLVERCDADRMPVDVGRFVVTEDEAIAITRNLA